MAPDEGMTPERWRQVEAVFYGAIEREGADRVAYLDAACAGDAALRREVDSLLAAAEDADGYLDTPVSHEVLAPAHEDLTPRLQRALGTDYRVERELGGGGMSRVFVAEEMALGRRVVVKVLQPSFGAALDAERFRREGRLAASLRHPHIVPLLASGESADGLVYFTMPFIEGESLRRRLDREGALPVGDVARIVREVADALTYAHKRGVVHRDVKPGNVLVDGEHVVVADFGIAKAVMAGVGHGDRRSAIGGGHSERGGESCAHVHSPNERRLPLADSLTLRSSIIGTPGYMSPEQARGDADVDGRSDVYSLGCLAFEMLTGARPFPSDGNRTSAPRASALRSELPRVVDPVIARALAPDRAQRFDAAIDFAAALEEALGISGGRSVAIDPSPGGGGLGRRWAVGVLAALFAAVVISAPLVWRRAARQAAGSSTPVSSNKPDRPTIAVLPFENLGRPEDAYFADGVTDELTTRLAGLRRLRVVSRTSARNYRATKLSLPEVGRELGADYLLEGTVQWERTPNGQGRVRVRPRLVRATDDTQLWADAFDGDLTDVFALEGAIGERVAAALDVALPGGDRATLATRPTQSFEAYNYFLRGEALRGSGDDRRSWLQSLAWYDSAIARDPRFALALARRSQQHIAGYWAYYDRSDQRTGLARADADSAVAIVPALPEARLALGLYYYRARRDYERALDEFTKGLQQQPENGELLAARGFVLRRMGRLGDARQAFEAASELDPRSWVNWWDLGTTSMYLRDYEAALRYLERATAINASWAVPYADRAMIEVAWRGDVAAAIATVRAAIPLVDVGQLMTRLRYHAPGFVPPGVAGDSLITRLDSRAFSSLAEYLLWISNWHRVRGSRDASRAYADSARALLEREVRRSPRDAGLHMRLSLAFAFRGDADQARSGATRAVELSPSSADAIEAADMRSDQAFVEMLVGSADSAVAILERVIPFSAEVTLNALRRDPLWAPLRGNARFERLLAGQPR